jgi:hypothetical protein
MSKKDDLELIERYVTAVGRRLSDRQRKDVETELRSSLLDMLDDREVSTGSSGEKGLAYEILRGMESPEEMAARYEGTRYLIGPRLYQSFVTAARVVLIIVVAQFVIGLLVGLSESSAGEPLAVIGDALAGLYAALFGSLGMLVLIFALLERFVLKYADESGRTWDPRQLPAADASDHVRASGVVFRIVTAVFALLLVNFFRDWVGVAYLRDGVWHHFSVLTPAFDAYVRPINVLLLLRIGLNVDLLRQGEWRPVSHWIRLGLTIAGMVVVAAMIAGPPVATISASEMALAGGIEFDLKPFLILILLFQAIALAKIVMRRRLYLQIPLRRQA